MNTKFLVSLLGVAVTAFVGTYTTNPDATWQVYAAAILAAVIAYVLGLNQDPNTQPGFMRRIFRRG